MNTHAASTTHHGIPFAVLVRRRFFAHRMATVSLIVLTGLTTLACLASPIEMILETDTASVDLFNRFSEPTLDHPLGTDELGRDTLVRLMQGGQVSLFVGLFAALIAATIGTVIGIVAGYFGGWLDHLLMRVTDGVIALPLLPLLIVLAALDLSKLGLPRDLTDSENISLYRIIIIVSLAGWTTSARLVRANTLALRERPFILAARAQGANDVHIMTVHILPNLASPIVVATTLSIGNIILLESVLSFLGLGIQPPVPSWGNLLTNAQELIWQAPMMAFYPGVLIFITVIAFNFIGDGLQDAMDPRATNTPSA
jgi:peptide/nickel transport system permease protein